jgi:hypothetical protein
VQKLIAFWTKVFAIFISGLKKFGCGTHLSILMPSCPVNITVLHPDNKYLLTKSMEKLSFQSLKQQQIDLRSR